MNLHGDPRRQRDVLRVAVGYAALIAPILHSATDVMEWIQHGFSTPQLWLNYVAFLPMAWLLLGVHALHDPRPGIIGLIGAILYGAAFTYFAHSTVYAISEHIPSYDILWSRLGTIYTVHGAFMVAGGLLFAGSAWHAAWLPRPSVAMFAAGLIVNLLLALIPAPDILQTFGSALRNVGLALMGYFLVFGAGGQQSKPPAGLR